jgi:hypothetical protein
VFGCKIIDDKLPFDLSGFSDCIQSDKAHPNVYFSIDKRIEPKKENYAATSQMRVAQLGVPPKVIYAAWYYIIGKIPIKILYYIDTPPIHVHGNMIHPTTGKKFLRLT